MLLPMEYIFRIPEFTFAVAEVNGSEWTTAWAVTMGGDEVGTVCVSMLFTVFENECDAAGVVRLVGCWSMLMVIVVCVCVVSMALGV